MQSVGRSSLTIAVLLGGGVASAHPQTVRTSVVLTPGVEMIVFSPGVSPRRGAFVRFDRDTLVLSLRRHNVAPSRARESRPVVSASIDTLRLPLGTLDSMSAVRQSRRTGRREAMEHLGPMGIIGGAFYGMIGGLGYGAVSKSVSVPTGVARGGLWGAGILGTAGLVTGAIRGTDGTWERVAWSIT